MSELCEIAYKYGTDKCPQLKHEYTPFYYELLKDKKQSFKKIFEMGIGYEDTMMHVEEYQTGASLYMWREFFPNAHIYGADISPEAIFQDDRITTFVCDERNKEEIEEIIKKVGSDIDLFIDDGSHNKDDQIFLCQTVMPMLKKDVIYIIEDVIYSDTIPRKLPQYDCELKRFSNNEKIIIVKNKNK